MKFSLILATVGRTDEVVHLLRSLGDQVLKEFEVIVVDQNPDDRLADVLKHFQDRFPVQHLRSETGLSRARNVGLERFRGEIAAFPDDDCWYPPDLLQSVAGFFAANPAWDALICRVVTASGNPAVGRQPLSSGKVTPGNVWTRANSNALFLRKHVLEVTGAFNEELGLGSGTPWGGAEEIEYVVRALRNEFRIYYDPGITVCHPADPPFSDPEGRDRHFRYGLGMGRALKISEYPLWFVAWMWFRPLAGAFISLLQFNGAKASYHFQGFLGRYRGWRGSP